MKQNTSGDIWSFKIRICYDCEILYVGYKDI